MGFRFQRRIRICKGLNINLSKSGIGISAGPRGAKIGISSKGQPYTSVGIPGTGISYRTNLKAPKGGQVQQPANQASGQYVPPPGPAAPYNMPFETKLALVVIAAAAFIWVVIAIFAQATSKPAYQPATTAPVEAQQQAPAPAPAPVSVYTYPTPSTATTTDTNSYSSSSPNYIPPSTGSSYDAPVPSGGSVQHVSGYYRKDGTYVHSYTRRRR